MTTLETESEENKYELSRSWERVRKSEDTTTEGAMADYSRIKPLF